MIGKILMFLGLRKAAKQSFLSRRGPYLAPVGGIVPALAWLGWQNRAKLKSMYHSYLEPRLPHRTPTKRKMSQPYAAVT
jgi:hypothetical protein